MLEIALGGDGTELCSKARVTFWHGWLQTNSGDTPGMAEWRFEVNLS